MKRFELEAELTFPSLFERFHRSGFLLTESTKRRETKEWGTRERVRNGGEERGRDGWRRKLRKRKREVERGRLMA